MREDETYPIINICKGINGLQPLETLPKDMLNVFALAVKDQRLP